MQADLVVVALYLAAVLAIGGVFARGQRSLKEFFLAGRSIPWWAAALSGMATMMSAVGYLGAPGQAYAGDWRYLQMRLAVLPALLIAGFLVLPFFHRLEVYTAYEYLERRFDRRTRLLAAVLFLLLKLFYTGVAIYAPALVVAEMTGWPLLWVVLGIGALTTLYTTLGGIRAVIWTDALQMVVLTAGIVLALWLVITRVEGGFGGIVSTAMAAGKMHFFDWSLDPTVEFTVWNGIVGGTFYLVSQYAVDQAEIQRFLTTKSVSGCRRAMVWSLLANAVLGVVLFFVGTALWVFYQQHAPGEAIQPDRVFPKFILEEIPAGLRGLLIAGVFAAAMSTVSSILNSLAAVVVRDLRTFREDDAHTGMAWARYATFAAGAGATALSLYTAQLGNVLVAAGKIRGFFGGVLVGLFLLGMLSRRATGFGAFWGVIVGFVGVSLMAAYTPISWLWYTAFATVCTYGAGEVLSRRDPAPERAKLEGLVWKP
ncbi:MAG: sodium/solute symporter [Acidobacteria bacterium]|nr:sodium/solute symporter [Acidobacteriota bacterium]